MKVEILCTQSQTCDAFVAGRPDSKICHFFNWSDAIAKGSGLEIFYLVAGDSEGVHGILPLAHVKSILFGNFMVSQGFSNYGGPLTDSPLAQDVLFNYAVELAGKLNCTSVEFRNITPLPYALELRADKMCMHLPLDPDPDKVWNAFDAKVRNQVRKAEKSGITADQGGLELLDDFYEVYTVRMRQLGTPPYPKKLLRDLIQAFPNNSRLFVVRLDRLTVGAAITFCYNGFSEILYASTLVQFNNLCPNNLLYWSVIKHYCISGAKFFDFGRCTIDGPTYKFKKQWGPIPVDMHYQYWVSPGRKLSFLSPDNAKYKKKVEMWKKLPLWFTRAVGPYISRNLP